MCAAVRTETGCDRSVRATGPEQFPRHGPEPADLRTEQEEDWSFAAAIAHDLDPADSIMMAPESIRRQIAFQLLFGVSLV